MPDQLCCGEHQPAAFGVFPGGGKNLPEMNFDRLAEIGAEEPTP